MKTITFNRETKDYDAYLDGDYIGSFANHHEAEVELGNLAYEQLRRAPAEVAEVYVTCGHCGGPHASGVCGVYCVPNTTGEIWTRCGALTDGPCVCGGVVDSRPAEVHARPADVAEPIYVSAPIADAPSVAPTATPAPAATIAASPVTDQAVAAALEQLAEREAMAARHARTRARCPKLTEEQREEIRKETSFFQRAANAYTKALLYWTDGIRPERTEAGNYLLPSQRAGEPPHLLAMQGDWICTCAAGATAHWAKMLIIGLEAAHDALEAETVGDSSWNGYTDPETKYDADDYADEAPATTLGQRLAWARAEIEINELFT